MSAAIFLAPSCQMQPQKLQSKAWSCSDLCRAAATVVQMASLPGDMPEELSGLSAAELRHLLEDWNPKLAVSFKRIVSLFGTWGEQVMCCRYSCQNGYAILAQVLPSLWSISKPAAQANCIAKNDVLLQLPALVWYFQFYSGTQTYLPNMFAQRDCTIAKNPLTDSLQTKSLIGLRRMPWPLRGISWKISCLLWSWP